MKKTKTRRNRRRKQTIRRKIRGGVGKVSVSDDGNTCIVYITNLAGPNIQNNTPSVLFEKIKNTDYWRSYWANVVDILKQSGQMKANVHEYMNGLTLNTNMYDDMSYHEAVTIIYEDNINNNKRRVIDFRLNKSAYNKFCVLTTEQIKGLAQWL